MDNSYAEVVVSIEHSAVDREYDYVVLPQLADKVRVGVEVVVPFGRRQVTGYVVGLKAETDVPQSKLRPIQKVLHNAETVITEELLSIARKMADYYQVPLVSAISCIVPGEARGLERTARPLYQRLAVLSMDKLPDDVLLQLRRAPKQRAIVEQLMAVGQMSTADLLSATQASSSSLKALVKKGLVTIKEREVLRSPLSDSVPTRGFRRPTLTPEQSSAVSLIIQALEAGDSTPILVHGVTGSGKTEIYLRSLEYCMKRGKQAILLVPEIALTPQTIEILSNRFGDKIAVLHSSLSPGERFDEWRRAKRGDARIIVGARSAVFAPCQELGLIIIDEEHESSYKQEEGVRYHARQVAQWRSQNCRAPLVLGSATPAVETYYKAVRREYKCVFLPNRINLEPLPKVTVVDMRTELKAGNTSIFSSLLQQRISERLNRNEKVILFLNRRGYASFVMCRACGYVCRCDNCDISLTYHAATHRLHCHYCQARHRVPTSCPQCGSKAIKPFGAGTELVEKTVGQLFPQARVVRMDSDTTRSKNSHRDLLAAFASGPANVLVGTQMIAKGLDIPEVTLVGIVSADTTLHIPDFRASERTFQLLTQVAGRAGRGEKPGEVVVQTYSPGEYSITTAQRHDFRTFYDREIAIRRELGYPPFGQLINITCSHPVEKVAARAARFLVRQLNSSIDARVAVLGPAPAPLARIKRRYRWHLVLKLPDGLVITDRLRPVVQELRQRAQSLKLPLRVIVDVDPQSIL